MDLDFDFFGGYETQLQKAQTLHNSWQYAKSNEILAEIPPMFQNDPKIFQLRGKNFQSLGLWNQALDCWQSLLLLSPTDAIAKKNQPECLWNLGKKEEALDLFESLAKELPQDCGVHIQRLFCKISTSQVSEIVQELTHLKQTINDKKEFGRLLDQARSKLISLHDSLTIINADPENILELQAQTQKLGYNLKDIYENFESLGCDCEFGFIQRKSGAEPLGLFRWTGIKHAELIRLLQCNLEGFDRPENYELRGNHAVEYILCDKEYGTDSHTNVNSSDIEADLFLEKLRKRQTFLVRKFREDIASGSKIFVHKAHEDISEVMIDNLLQTVTALGAKFLLVVQKTKDPATDLPGSTRMLKENCMLGFLSSTMPDMQKPQWDKIVVSAYDHFKPTK